MLVDSYSCLSTGLSTYEESSSERDALRRKEKDAMDECWCDTCLSNASEADDGDE